MSAEELFVIIKANPGIHQKEIANNDGRHSKQLRALVRDEKIERVWDTESPYGGYRCYPIDKKEVVTK